MNRRFLITGAFVAAVAIASTAALTWASGPTKIVVEAEHYYTIVPSMMVVKSDIASDKAYIQIPLSRPHGTKEGAPKDEGRATYKIDVPVSGRYKFWGRVHWHDGCGNSFFVKVDDKPPVVFGQDATYQRWHWREGLEYELSAGVHTIIVQNREDGSKLDEFMLTTDTRYKPVRAEKETSEYVIRKKEH